MTLLKWFDRNFTFGLPNAMLPFYLERLAGTSTRMRAKLDGIDDSILSEKYNGKWSVKQHIGHLAEVDQVASKRIVEMVSGKPELSPAVFEPKDYSTWALQEVLDHFDRIRKENLSHYEKLTEEQLQMASLHPRLKVMMTPVDLAFFDAEHDDHHLVAINEIVKALLKEKATS
ncbi:DinB family protein [Flavihumibacter solisilvae]|uniref:DinB-like domain-containing protein n=1 Tax=Flavihumibacter solisilvae TaxID=1349421 RepID=A0A0C1IWT2_9BACT|nr:DinB family protein [Flavihumibacter solisilvae]KIC94944.1 hypothetical protein OI18_08575 [Flavihumibacter solisilvae]